MQPERDISVLPYSKAKLDDDDGRGVYEIEFYVGNTEYDYKIDAYSGGIIEYDIDRD
nr:PepSY domain-containing protein [uncultured Stomatobaculum sp.]